MLAGGAVLNPDKQTLSLDDTKNDWHSPKEKQFHGLSIPTSETISAFSECEKYRKQYYAFVEYALLQFVNSFC